jgi:hypothetical protein
MRGKARIITLVATILTAVLQLASLLAKKRNR